jgi:membrane peptidoglycan carboxypeptidase
MLEAAMDRSYSASPAERFFTGGGVHTFVNFDASWNNRTITLREAFRHSVNVPFIRLMRDITLYYTHRLPGAPAGILGTRGDLRRREYLERFADDEGRVFLTQFYRKYVGQPSAHAMETLLEGRSLSPTRLAWAYRSINPEADSAVFSTWVTSHVSEGGISDAGVRDLYRRTNPANMSLNDRGYLAGIHPLELWLLEHLSRNPEATLATVVDSSREVRQEVYQWLFATSRTAAQDQRIRSILEAEAFREIHKAWRRLGYPFASLVPSYATALGSSADRPDALGELVGIIVNGGVRRPQVRVTQLDFAAGTPYEAH